MNHKKLVGGDGVDLEPDYVFIVQKLRAPLLIDGLKDLKIDFKSFTCKNLWFFNVSFIAALNPDRVLLVIFFSDDLLDEMAEIYELPVRLLD